MINNQVQIARQHGFTLIELMVVVVISAILLAIAVPSFQVLIKRSNVDSMQSKLSSSFSTARTEAASRNKVITICGSDDAATCTGADWRDGWIVFEDDDSDRVIDAGEELIDVYENSTAYTVKISPAATVAISFNSQGFIIGGAVTLLTVCEPDNDAAYARGLLLNTSGLVMKTRDMNNNGKHDNPTAVGTDLTCP